MPIILEATYGKKLGLPNHGSHSYALSLRTELTDIEQMSDESSRLYRMLQEAVDREIQQTGYVPDHGVNGSATGNADAGSVRRQWPHHARAEAHPCRTINSR